MSSRAMRFEIPTDDAERTSKSIPRSSVGRSRSGPARSRIG
jgi:hypothetical protein